MASPTLTLHRYFIWANRMRTHFDALPGLSSLEFGTPRFTEAVLYMSYWYAALYVVIEGWKKLGLHAPVIDALLTSPMLTFCAGIGTVSSLPAGVHG